MCSHLVDALVQPGTWKIEGLLGSNVPVASKVLAIDEYNSLLPALQQSKESVSHPAKPANVKSHGKAETLLDTCHAFFSELPVDQCEWIS